MSDQQERPAARWRAGRASDAHQHRGDNFRWGWQQSKRSGSLSQPRHRCAGSGDYAWFADRQLEWHL